MSVFSLAETSETPSPPQPMSITPLPMPIYFHNSTNFDGSPGKAMAFFYQLCIFVTEKMLFPNPEQKVVYAVSLLSNSATI